MKKQILATLVTLLTAISAFAGSETSLLQHVETASCRTADLRAALVKTAAIESADKSNQHPLTIIERALNITSEEKSQGVVTTVEGTYARSSQRRHARSIVLAQAKADQGEVGITQPASFDVVFNVKDAAGKMIKRGRAMVGITCRIAKGSQTTAQLISFDIQAKAK